MVQHLKLKDTEPIFSRVRLQARMSVLKWSVCAFCGVLFGCTLVESGIQIVLMLLFGIKMDSVLVQIYLTVIDTTAAICFCKFAENRPLRTMGIRKTKLLPDYLLGIVIGIGMFSAVVGSNCLLGTMHNQGKAENISWGIVVLYFIGWILQGFSEEILCRGFLMQDLGAVGKPWYAVIVSALVFAALHLGNEHISVLAFINLVLFGIFAGILYLRTDSIWMVAALHSLWNFAQGNVYGIEVSGMKIPEKVLQFQATESGKWINGGAFGVEGGFATTIVFASGILITLLWKQRKIEA